MKRAIGQITFLVLSILTLVILSACGGGSQNAAPVANNPPPPPPSATAPAIGLQPVSASVTAPAAATFSATASSTGSLSYQWRSSANGTDWTPIAGATGASYETGATDAGMDGRYYSVVISNSAGNVTSASVQLTVITPPTGGGPGDPNDPPPTTGVFPHAPNPLSVAVTPAEASIAQFVLMSYGDSAVEVPGDAANLPLAAGVTVSLGFSGNSFFDNQTLSVTPVTLAGLGAGNPLPFQSVIGTFQVHPAESPEADLQTHNRMQVTFTFTQAALDVLGGQPVIFTALADGTQLHLVPVYENEDGTWPALSLTTSVGHLGIFGVAMIDGAQAATLANAWPSGHDLQLQAAIATPSYELRRTVPITRAKARPLRTQLEARINETTEDWSRERQAIIDAYYHDVVEPALQTANSPNASPADITDAARKLMNWERERQLLGLDDTDVNVPEMLVQLAEHAFDLSMQDCQANHNSAALVQVLKSMRQLELLGRPAPTTLATVMETCGRSRFEVTMDFAQSHSWDYEVRNDISPAVTMTGTARGNTSVTGKVHIGENSNTEITASNLTHTDFYEEICAEGAYSCIYAKRTEAANDPAPQVTRCVFYPAVEVSRWNLDVRGILAKPDIALMITGTCAGINGGYNFTVNTDQMTETFTRGNEPTTTRVIPKWEDVDARQWSGVYRVGSTTKILRRSAPIVGALVVPGALERWTTTLNVQIVEVIPTN